MVEGIGLSPGVDERCQRGTKFALASQCRVKNVHLLAVGDTMDSKVVPAADQKSGSSVSLETVIAVGLFGWLALSMTLMGLGIW